MTTSNRKIVYVVLDGISGRPVRELDGLTPLQGSDTPNLNYITKNGSSGIMDPISPGIRPGSDTAHLSLLGYSSKSIYSGRGPFEAAGAGIDIKEGDIAFRCNYATISEGIIKNRRAGRIKNTRELYKSIKEEIREIEDVKIIFKDSTAHRAALVLRGPQISDKVSDSDPKTVNKSPKEVKPLSSGRKEKKTARILNKFIDKTSTLLDNHHLNIKRLQDGKLPANIILIRGGGKVSNIKSFYDKYGIKGGIVSGTGIIRGMGRALDMDVIEAKGLTGGLDSNLIKKVDKAVEALKYNDFLLIHIKGADVAGHDGEYKQKIKFIEEKIDPAVGKLLELINKNETILAVTADHSTPVSVMDHSADPVPVVISGNGVRIDDNDKFDEYLHNGAICRIKGTDLINICLDIANLSEKFGV